MTISRRKVADASSTDLGYSRAGRKGVSRLPAVWQVFRGGEPVGTLEGRRYHAYDHSLTVYGSWPAIQARLAR